MKHQFLIIFVYVAIMLVRTQSCKTPEDQPREGICKRLTDCKELKTAMNLRTITPLAFSKFRCGDSGNYCCPILAPNPKLSPVTGCGTQKPEYRILGGNETRIDEYPWAVLLEYEDINNNNKKGFHCGGTLINNRYVLTAAHCVKKMNHLNLKRVRLGEWDFNSSRDCKDGKCAPPVIDNNIVEEIVHPEYSVDSPEQHNDIALLRLAKILDFTDFVRPICLPLEENDDPKYIDGVSLEVTGWGKSNTTKGDDMNNIKLKTTLEGRNIDVCSKHYQNSGRSVLPERQLCVGGFGEGKDTCNGDSGGPLMHKNDNKELWYLTGIVSYGDNNCDTNKPSLYTKVSAYIKWIASNIRP